MNVIDLTYTLSEETQPFPGKTRFSRSCCACYEKGFRLEDMHLSFGLGTHMDAPFHVDPKGVGVDEIPLSQCYGHVCVLQLSHKVLENADYSISVEDLLEWEQKHGPIPRDSIVFAHTGWGKYWGKEKFCFQDQNLVCHFPGFSGQAAQLLTERHVKGVGIDTMSIDTGDAKEPSAHLAFLKNKIYVIENLNNLELLPPIGAYAWIAPMKIKNAPEAPVRAFAIIK